MLVNFRVEYHVEVLLGILTKFLKLSQSVLRVFGIDDHPIKRRSILRRPTALRRW
jgi:hypothetical protein